MLVNLPTEIFTYPDVQLPRVWRVSQRHEAPSLTTSEIQDAVTAAVGKLLHERSLPSGAQIAVGVGSRGLNNLLTVVQCVVRELVKEGFNPFIIPAMGSHGGATADGQASLLHDYLITEENVGCSICATMEVEQVGVLSGADAGPYTGFPVYCDQNAFRADAILLINRIKAHTDFSGVLESGIGKMAAIGLGKRFGAEAIHRYGAAGLADLLPRVARFQSAHLPLLGGVALIENPEGLTCEVHALTASHIGREPEVTLLERARLLAPSLPFKDIDVLIIDEMGKNISGTGMDTHVIGRLQMPSLDEAAWDGPKVRLIAVLDLTDESHGNASSLGLAYITTERLVSRTDFAATLINARTSGEGGVLRARLPLVLPDADACIRAAIATCGRKDASDVRLVRIRNTARTTVLEISEALLAEAGSNRQLTVEDLPHVIDCTVPLTS